MQPQVQQRPGRPHHVVHPTQREPCLITGIEAAPSQPTAVPTIFVERPAQHGQRSQGPAMVVQLGRLTGNPANQPDIQLLVTVDAGVPALRLRDTTVG
ncbi:Uncharacterised protein [Mycobacterium tuberculosis]|uniref:Uncharacterized protein n=2 Tax=Mycobacterium tuberculosis TaxID=1773 RepID=A0A655JDA2_MYCTX|nr:Uncharacterised protein [Mycobacterium tuberculosis]